ncbi:hypothetical protein STEG23_014897 [Scotinomys teguina]
MQLGIDKRGFSAEGQLNGLQNTLSPAAFMPIASSTERNEERDRNTKSMTWSSTKTYRRNRKHPEFWCYSANRTLTLTLSSQSRDEQPVKYRKLEREDQDVLQYTGVQKGDCDSQLQTKLMVCQGVLASVLPGLRDLDLPRCIAFLEPLSRHPHSPLRSVLTHLPAVQP